MRKILLSMMVLGLLSSCTKTITKGQYIGAMEAIGCKNSTEGTDVAASILKEKGLTEGDIKNFRQHTNAKAMMEVAGEIVKGVAACHGVDMPE